MDFDWYTEIAFSDEITQGDIITNCIIPLPNVELYNAVLESKEEVPASIEVKKANIMVLSQACDIVNDKVDSIVVCPIWPLEILIETNDYFKASGARESLRQGKEPSYHLLNSYKTENIALGFSVVDFHRIYSLPKDYLKNIAVRVNIRLRLLPPYREHLSQAFARYFMRVGLPLDIDRESIKNFTSRNSKA